MSDLPLIERNDALRTVRYTESAHALKQEALESASVVFLVRNEEEKAVAMEAMGKIKAVIDQAESLRKEVKEPVWLFCQAIDSAAKRFKADLEPEQMRLAKILGDYRALQEARQRAEQAALKAELLEVERAKAREMAQATTHEQAEAVAEKFERVAAAIPVPAPIPQAKGEVARADWEITVTDIHALYRSQPNCVKLEPLLTQIKAVLDANDGKCAGVKAERKTKIGVRAPRHGQLIEIGGK